MVPYYPAGISQKAQREKAAAYYLLNYIRTPLPKK